MHFKLIIAFVEDTKTSTVMEAARNAGATGATVISNARGEGMKKSKTFLGLSLETQRDVLMFLVEEHLVLIKTATRRDIHDEETAIFCARRIKNVGRLKLLYLLTVADSTATGPSGTT